MSFFLYTFIGSVFMPIGLIYLYLKGGIADRRHGCCRSA